MHAVAELRSWIHPVHSRRRVFLSQIKGIIIIMLLLGPAMPMHQCIISRDNLLPVTHADSSSDTTSTTTRAWSKSKSSPPWKHAALSKGSATGLKKSSLPFPFAFVCLPASNLRCAYPSAPSRAGQTQTPDGGRCLTPCLTR